MKLHKVAINSLSFSPNEKYLISAGGQDDNTLVVWDTETGKAVAGTPAMGDTINEVKFYNQSNSNLISVHNGTVKLWNLDVERKKVGLVVSIIYNDLDPTHPSQSRTNQEKYHECDYRSFR